MKKIFKSLMAVLSLALLVASCEQSPVKADYDYTFDESQRGYSFSAPCQGASFKVGYEDSIYTVRVFRNYTEGEESLSLINAGDVDVFEMPEAVTFANGSTVAEFDLDIRISSLVPPPKSLLLLMHLVCSMVPISWAKIPPCWKVLT